MTIRKNVTLFISICILICCFAIVAEASKGFVELKYKLISMNQNGYSKYTIVNRAELEDYAVWGSMTIQSTGGTFDNRGTTFQAFFECRAVRIELVGGKNTPEVMAPARTIASYTVDANDETIAFVSKKAEYEKPTSYGGNMHCLWQIEPDGDYTVVCSSRDTGLMKDMYQYY